MNDRFTLHSAVYLVLIRDGATLLLRRFNTGWRDGDYSLVAGHLDGNETVTDAIIREAKEEARIDLAREDIRIAVTMHRKSLRREYIDFFATAERWSGTIEIGEPDKCDDLSWFAIDNLPTNTLPYVREAIECVRAGRTFVESGWRGDAI